MTFLAMRLTVRMPYRAPSAAEGKLGVRPDDLVTREAMAAFIIRAFPS